MEIKLFKNFDKELANLKMVTQEISEVPVGPDNVERIETSRKMAADFVKRVELVRKAVTKVLDDRKKSIMASEKDFVLDLKLGLAKVTENLEAYYQNQLEVSERQREAVNQEHGKATEGVDDFEKLIEADINLNLANAKIDDDNRGFRTATDWDVVDFEILPDFFKIINNTAIGQAIKDGQEVPGVKVLKKAIRTGKI